MLIRGGSSDAPFDLSAYPSDPERVERGELAVLRLREREMSERGYRLGQECSSLEQRLAELKRVVERATPMSDFTEIAAAEAGVRIVERALTRARDQRDRHRGDFEVVAREHYEARVAYRRTLADLPQAEREVRAERRLLRQKLVELAGEPEAYR